jgi:N-acetylmuramoyl-L-alanine amidase
MLPGMVLLLSLACAAPNPFSAVRRPDDRERPAAPEWPSAGAPLFTLAPRVPPGRHRVVLDPGHGAPGNDGNTGVLCQKEAVEMLRIGARVEQVLEHPGLLDVRSTRPNGAVTDYGTRIREADAWGEVLVSFHSDARSGRTYGIDPVTGCPGGEGGYGFAVLWSDEGGAALVRDRKRLAAAIAARMVQAGFFPYGGDNYTGLYEGDPDHPGTFVDRHEPQQRIRMLRRPKIPSVIVETHNAPDREEVARWSETGTVDVFAAALRAALGDFFVR